MQWSLTGKSWAGYLYYPTGNNSVISNACGME